MPRSTIVWILVAASAGASPPAAPLPLRKLRLYETGVAYFERSGRLDARGATLPVPTGHLDDVLKSLVLLSTDGAHIQGVDFSSSVSKGMARTLAGLPPEGTAPIGYSDLLGSLKGTRVRVATAHETFGARLVDVLDEELLQEAPKDHPGPPQPVKELVLLLVTDNSEVRRLRARDVVSVRASEAGSATRLGAALDALSAHGAQAERALHVSGTGGTVALGYIGEAPLWRTTYRLVLGDKGRNALQGWALIHNDTDEDWDGVRVELVNGRPDSFLFPLAAPRYAGRELVTPQDELSTVPQLLDTTVDEMWGDHSGVVSGGMGLSGTGSGAGGYGMGVGSLGTVGHGSGVAGSAESGSSDLLAVGNLAPVENAEGVEAGVLFTYRLAEPLRLKARASALVSLFQRKVDAERITWLPSSSDSPRSAIRFVNSTDQTLPSGPISLFSEGGFSGEASLERLKPGEQRFVQFGADLDVELSLSTTAESDQVKRLAFQQESLEEHYLKKSHLAYEVENRSGQPRVVYVGLALSSNAQVKGADGIEADPVSGHPMAMFRVGPRARLDRPVDAVEGLVRRTKLSALTAEKLRALAALTDLPESDRAAAREAADRQTELERSQVSLQQTQAAIHQVDADILRLRDHLKALQGDNPFIQRLVKAEDQLISLRKQEAALEGEKRARADAVRGALVKLPRKSPPSALSSR